MIPIQRFADPTRAVRAAGCETGTLPGGHPYVRAGSKPRSLVVLPGFGDAMFSGDYPPFSGWALASYFARYLRTHEIYLLSRPRKLPPGYGPADAVETHARALEAIVDAGGTIDVIGISMGGLIGQALARRRPDLVDRLVLANSAARLDDGARPAIRRFERYARERDWAAIRADLAAAMFADGRAVAYPLAARTVGRFLQARPAEPADVSRSLAFVRRFDGRDELADVERPTLVFGGERDPYFTAERTRETAEALPRGELELVPGAKHGAFHERKATFDSSVRSFFERSTAPGE
ncbi:alpha/beta fold hydrolase [Natrarchaeobius oligotrophus]|uniref:Alpha/beta fold hydrolase n=1 Tax=Natrarchaeobius chitinivorans TaxID=1679083 RepID=A0A3N6MUY6_NATCH|nr:alpha/beta hydrolase [Natrarchaeobius chitinivorans]RQG98686.1 alpha/beta fold hydrolase [Natrarchaeobius chitinivorans]